MSDPLPLLDAALRGATITLLLLLAARLLRDRPGAWGSRMSAALGAGLCVQVVASTPLFEAGVPWRWQTPLVAVSVGNAVLFWLFALALFRDGWRLRPRHAAVWLAVLALAWLQCSRPSAAGALAMRWLPLFFALLAMAAAVSRWQGDLVEPRRNLRSFIVVGGSLYTLVLVALRLAAPQGRLSPPMAALDMALLLCILGGMAGRLLRTADAGLFEPVPAAARPAILQPPAVPAVPLPGSSNVAAADPAEDRLAQALHSVMQNDQVWRDEDLGVAALARRLAVPEYRLRRLINQRLGHRNFSAYVNRFRLDEAQRVLADPARRDQAVLNVALDAGFGSIGPFNRAFKADTGLTPTEFRRHRLADS